MPAEPQRKRVAIQQPGASFQGVTPGITTASEVKDLLGNPLEESQDGAVLTYKLGPFPSSEFLVSDNVVQSVVVHLDDLVTPAAMAKELALEELAPALVVDEQGQPLGQVYPERGILFSYASGSGRSQVSHVILEPPSAESFVLRAEQLLARDVAQCRADLDQAEILQPDDARIYYLRSSSFAMTGQWKEALAAIEPARRIHPEDLEYRLWEAHVAAQAGRAQNASQLLNPLLSQSDVPAQWQARAHYELGQLLMAAPKPDYSKATEHFLAAIELATEPATADDYQVRRTALRVLVDAHLGVAESIARGNWRKQDQVVPQWVATATELMRGLVEHDGGEPFRELQVHRRALAAYATLNDAVDAADALRSASTIGENLLARVEDDLAKAMIERELAQAFLDGARIESVRKNHDGALQHASAALSAAKSIAGRSAISADDSLLLGEIYAMLGSIYGVTREDHATAITWYNRALVQFQGAAASRIADKAEHGDRLVAMGVSYWSQGDQQQGLRVTQQGVTFLRHAVDAGLVDSKVLTVPYGNLATMHRHLGNSAEAKLFSDLADRSGSPPQATVGRRSISD